MNFGKSITGKFVAVLLLVLVVGQGVGTFFYLRNTRSNLVDSLHKRMARTVKQAAGISAEPIMNYNFALLDSYLKESLEDEDIESMQFLGKKGEVIREKSINRGERQIFTIKQTISLYDEVIGTVVINYTTTTIDASMNRNLLLIPLYQGFMLVVAALVLVRLFNAYIKRPVTAINLAINQITAGDLAVSMPVLGDDEIGSIANGIRFLVERLAATITRVNAISANVAEAANQLNQTFDKVIRVVNDQQASTEQVSVAVREATESQRQIIANTDKLLSLSSDNVSALLQMGATSEEIANTTENLNKNVHNSYSTMTELSQSARQVAVMSNAVSSSIEEASSSVEEIYRSVKQVESMVKESAQLSHQTTSIIAEKGIASVANATTSMQGVESFIVALTAAIDRLDSRSKDIGKILAVIEDVTEKTRLLSFNAQIIAAQAGEHGKGFAVVANEMKELSDKTALSTREIENIVATIQHEISEVVGETRDTVKVVRSGNEIVGKTGEVLREIFNASQHATEIAKSIERASFEQTKGLELVVGATEQIKNRIYEVNRATTEQEKSTAFLLQNISPIKETMEVTRRATEEQVGSTRLISNNIELANQKTADIAIASAEQQQLNEQIITAMEGVMKRGKETVREVKGVAGFITSLREDVEALKKEMEVFRTSVNHPGAQLASGLQSGEADGTYEAPAHSFPPLPEEASPRNSFFTF